MREGKTRKWMGSSIRSKLIVPMFLTLAVTLTINFLFMDRINRTIENMDQVYVSNVQLEELKQILMDLEESIYEYLNIQSQDAYDEFVSSGMEFRQVIEGIDDTITDQPARAMERSLKKLGLSYLEVANQAVDAKKNYQVEVYKDKYEELCQIYSYLISYIEGLDALRFKINSQNYNTLYLYLRYLEIFITAVLILAAGSMMALLYIAIGKITRPLENLARKAELVSQGHWDIPPEPPLGEDEVGTVTVAFNQMIASINDYVGKMRENLERELEMKERELAMERLLKDARLKYYQAQINPHFLFNTLNAGLQLAMMEDAERTYIFIENIAQFFRYRLRKNGEGSTLGEEMAVIENYMYIMNVRYANEIHIHKSVDSSLLEIRYPGMVLQPLVENALKHGLGGVEWKKEIWLTVERDGPEALVTLRDNGVGMEPELLEAINSWQILPGKEDDTGNGVGMVNVRERLRLFFGREDVLRVESPGIGKGTVVYIRTPIWQVEPANEESDPTDR